MSFELERQLFLLGDVLAAKRQALVLVEDQAVAAWLEANQPELIVNAVAYIAVVKAESELVLSRHLNAEFPVQFAAYCAAHKVPLVHYSSD